MEVRQSDWVSYQLIMLFKILVILCPQLKFPINSNTLMLELEFPSKVTMPLLSLTSMIKLF